MNIGQAPEAYDKRDQDQMRGEIAKADKENVKAGRDYEVGVGRIIFTDPGTGERRRLILADGVFASGSMEADTAVPIGGSPEDAGCFIVSGCGLSTASLTATLASGQVAINGQTISITGQAFTFASADNSFDLWANADGSLETFDLNNDALPLFNDRIRLWRVVILSGAIYATRQMSQSAAWIKGARAATFTAREFIQTFVLTSGPYAGAWRYALNNGVRNYFGMTAVSLLAEVLPDQAVAYVKALLDLFVVGPWVSQGNWVLGQRIFRNGYVFRCTTAGQSAVTDAAFPGAGAGTITATFTDGTAHWITEATVPTTHTWFICDDHDAAGTYWAPDSHDSYAAKLCSAVYALARAGLIDSTWLNAASLFPKSGVAYYTRLETLYNLIYWNMLFYLGNGTGSPASTVGLTQTFQDKKTPAGAAYDVQFTQDNLEVYHGFRCAAWVYRNTMADSVTADALDAAAVVTKDGLAAHYDAGYGFFKNNNTETHAGVDQSLWYPFCVTQLMSATVNLDVDYATIKSSVDKAFLARPRWWKNAIDDFPVNVPAYELAEGAGYVGPLAECMTATQELFIAPHDGRFLVHHAGAYLATAQSLRRKPPL